MQISFPCLTWIPGGPAGPTGPCFPVSPCKTKCISLRWLVQINISKQKETQSPNQNVWSFVKVKANRQVLLFLQVVHPLHLLQVHPVFQVIRQVQLVLQSQAPPKSTGSLTGNNWQIFLSFMNQSHKEERPEYIKKSKVCHWYLLHQRGEKHLYLFTRWPCYSLLPWESLKALK